MSDFPYLHGFSEKEQRRLREQARFLEWLVYQGINFNDVKEVLEIGCGVGGQTEILLRRYPDIRVTGVDLNLKQLAAADQFLRTQPVAQDRWALHHMSGEQLSFPSAQFDGAFLCWILEHVPSPLAVVREAHRVLRPEGVIYVTEVMNSSFFLDPYSPHVWKYWMALNDYQHDQAGDPFVGAKLGNILQAASFRDIKTEIKSMFFDNRQPLQRQKALRYWSELMLSASEALVNAGYVDEATVEATRSELSQVTNDPNAVFFYSFIQAQARV